MDFVVENLTWFILGGIVILMTIIGYLADKTDFVSNKFSKKSNDAKTIKEKSEDIKEEVNLDINNQSEDLYNNINDINEINSSDNMLNQISKNNEISEIDENPVNVVSVVNDDLYAPINDVGQSNNTENLYTPISNSNASIDEPISEDLYAPMGDNTFNSVAVNNGDEVFKSDNVSTTDKEIPDNTFIDLHDSSKELYKPLEEDLITGEPVYIDDNSEKKTTADIWKF